MEREMDNIEVEKERLTAKMAFKDPTSAVIKIRQGLPDFLHSVKLKYVKLGVGYNFNFATLLVMILVLPLFIANTIHLTGLQLDHFLHIWSTQPELIDSATAMVVSLSSYFCWAPTGPPDPDPSTWSTSPATNPR
ncbi:unnamed protein product [Rhodiola kirilowii]